MNDDKNISLLNNYNEQISNLENDLFGVVESDFTASDFIQLQSRLDDLASLYQWNKSLGTRTYKLYEIQAYIDYYLRKDSEAMFFAEEAIKVKGENYSAMSDLITKLDTPLDSELTNSKKKTPLVQKDLPIRYLFLISLILFLLSGIISRGAIGAATIAGALICLIAGIVKGIKHSLR